MAFQTAEVAAGLCIEHVDGAGQVSGGEEFSVAAEGDGGGGVGEGGDWGFRVQSFAGEDGDAGGMRGDEIVRGCGRKGDGIYWESEGFRWCGFDVFRNFEGSPVFGLRGGSEFAGGGAELRLNREGFRHC